MRKYESYKYSGVEWIGKIPKSWKINKVGNNTYVKGRIGWKGLKSEDFIDEGPYLITGTDFNKDGSINWENTYHVNQERYDEDPFIQLQDNDVLITKDGTIGKVVYVGNLKGLSCLNSGIFLTRPIKNEYISKYFFWILNSNVFKVFVDHYSGGSTIQHLYQKVFVNFRFPIPSLTEQKKNVSYLDEKTSLIDSLIDKTQRKIEILKEERTTLINHTVTKGLNPNVEMKDSGVEWIGEIPSHWMKFKLNYISEKIGDGLHSTPKYVDFSEYYFINGNNLVNGEIKIFESTKCVDEEEYYKHYIELTENTLLLSINGTIGNLSFYRKEKVILGKSSCYINLKEDVNKNFIYYLLLCDSINKYFTFELTGTTIYNLSLNSVRNTPIVFPPRIEQEEIIQFLEDKISNTDKTILLEGKRIELLKEYRQSLIFEVITGKIKVTTDE